MRAGWILASVGIVATCGLLYELLAGTLASYMLGDTVREFAIVLGLYLAAMGLGASLSSRVQHNLAVWFVASEVVLALVGGTLVPVLYRAFGHRQGFAATLYTEVMVIGALVGLELPWLMRLLGRDLRFADVVARAMFVDYAGGLVASLLFPLLLLPDAGLVRTSLLVGLGNVAVALLGTHWFAPALGRSRWPLRVAGFAVAALLVAAMVYARRMEIWTGE